MAQGGTQEGVPLKTVGGGDSGKRQDGEPQTGAREVGGSRGRWRGPSESCTLGNTEGRSADAPGAPIPERQV